MRAPSIFDKHKIFIIACFFGALLIGVPIAMPMLDIKLPLRGAWKERFQDVRKLNDYAKTQPVELSNVKIENQNIDGAVINSGKFESTDWKNVSVRKSNLNKTVFSKGILEGVDFSDSTLTDVVFEDMMLWEVRFFGPTLNNVKFIRCTFNGVNLDRTKNSHIEVTHSKIINTSFSDGQLTAVFRHSKFEKGNELTSLIPPSSLTFEKSELDDVDLSRSVLNELVLDTVKSRKSGFDTGAVGKVTITGGDISFGLSETKIDDLKLHHLNSIGLALDDAVVKTIHVSDCRGTKDLNLYKATVGRMDVIRCPLNNFALAGSSIDTLYVKDGSISNSEFRKMKAKTVILENVTLDGELNFTNAHIGELKTKNVIQQPGLKLLTTGSNVRF